MSPARKRRREGSRPDPVELALLRDLLESVTEEMALVCRRTAVSPNIKERHDLSAALFDGKGTLLAHAAHIPVHLGAMPRSVEAALRIGPLIPGDVLLTNDPYGGGSHLPDLTMIRPVFRDARAPTPTFVVAVRAHHADVGGAVPGSMAPQDDIYGEGIRVPAIHWMRAGTIDATARTLLLANVRHPEERDADLLAQAGALARGAERLQEVAAGWGGLAALASRAGALVPYARRMAARALRDLPDAEARVSLRLDVEDRRGRPALIALALRKRGDRLRVDFTGTSGPVGMGLNAPRAVVESAVYHLVRCLGPAEAPPNAGLLEVAEIHLPTGSLLDPPRPQPVAGGNVETSQRLVDALWLAAAGCWPDRIPAPGAGTMSNWTFGPVPDGPAFPVYYETLPAGAGGGPKGPGADAIQQHMTNTRTTPVEAMEARWPVRVRRTQLRTRSGGAGKQPGGEGLVREIEFLAPARVGVLMTRHDEPPPGAVGGFPGAPGRITLFSARSLAAPAADASSPEAARRKGRRIGPRSSFRVAPGDVLRIETPGGGGWGPPRAAGHKR